MGEKGISVSPKSEDPAIVLRLLSAVERDSRVTQRRLSSELGIALGLANTYLRRCARKGLIKIRQVPMRRYAYYLTPRGFSEKSRLTAEYLTVSLDFFRRARLECTELLQSAAGRGWTRIALIGSGDLAEVGVLSAADAGATIFGIVDPARAGRHCAGYRVVSELSELETSIDAAMLCAIDNPQAQLKEALTAIRDIGLAPERLLVPSLLHVRLPTALAPAEAGR